MKKTRSDAQTLAIAVNLPAWFYWVAGGFGLMTGMAAGLVGVGGGEFRLPFLLYFCKQSPKSAAGINLVVGLGVVSVSVLRRWVLHQWDLDEVALTAILALASISGAWLGVRYVHRLPVHLLKGWMVYYLLVVGVWMLYETLVGEEHIFWAPEGAIRFMGGFAIGFGIAFISVAFGVAGGEMRIPALLYFFALPIQEAGTISLAASVPTVAMGAAAYSSLGYLPRAAILIAAVMGVGSVAGVFLGTAFLPSIDRHVLKAILGGILLLAAVTLLWEEKRRQAI